MIKIQAYLPNDIYMDLKLEANQKDVNFSELLRQIIDEHKKKEQKKNKKRTLKTMTLKNKGTTFISQEHNDIYD